MKLTNLNDLFVEQLRDIYYAEKQLVKALPKMAKHATDPKLKKAIEGHLSETEGQVSKLETVMESLDLPVKGEKCEAIVGLIKEAEELMSSAKDSETLDAAIILAGQKVEHYEIATYGCLCAFANRLGYEQQAEILHSILEEERGADEKLTMLAEKSPGINERAKAA
ncbi:MAG TPA: ferritin-like domain-containing protein [Alphaproteobacteria bacterium]|nr:ferritin-like domain-containing protein [Alphaproteobacteria bacterium]